MFGYRILSEGKTVFPDSSLVKVLNTLEDKKISYTIISNRENPITKSYDNLNNYHKILNKAYEYQDIKVRINRIYDKISSITYVEVLDSILKKLEDELFER